MTDSPGNFCNKVKSPLATNFTSRTSKISRTFTHTITWMKLWSVEMVLYFDHAHREVMRQMLFAIFSTTTGRILCEDKNEGRFEHLSYRIFFSLLRWLNSYIFFFTYWMVLILHHSTFCKNFKSTLRWVSNRVLSFRRKTE